MIGIDHLTVVPTNFDEVEDSGEEQKEEHEQTVNYKKIASDN